jgi:transcriptional adapter 2-alpha
MDLSFDIDPTEFQERKRRRISNMTVAPPLQKVAPTSAPGVHDIATFLPGRLEFEHEIDNEAEDLIKNLEFGLCMGLGGDSIPEDEDDHDYKTRMRWKVEQREKDHDQEMVFVPQNGLVNGAIHGNGNGLIVNGLNGAANGFVRKDKEVKKEKDTPAPDDNGDGVEEESEENMPPIPFETQASLEFKLTLIEMYMQRITKRREAKALMFDRGLLEYKKVCQLFYGWRLIIEVPLVTSRGEKTSERRKGYRPSITAICKAADCGGL